MLSKKFRARSRRVEYKVRKREADERLPPPAKKKVKQHHDWFVNGIPVSDHAVLRFVELFANVDFAELRQEMLADGRDETIRKNPNCKIPIGDTGAKLVVRSGVVVTVVMRPNEYKRGKK